MGTLTEGRQGVRVSRRRNMLVKSMVTPHSGQVDCELTLHAGRELFWMVRFVKPEMATQDCPFAAAAP